MTLQKNTMALISEGFKIVAEYYDKAGRTVTCLQKGNECVLRFNNKRSCFTKYYTNKNEANSHIKELINKYGYKRNKKI